MADDIKICPRAGEDGAVLSQLKPPFNGEMVWREDHTCSYCGSYDPDLLMDRLARGDVELGPTDKNYKVYLHNKGGEPFQQTYRDCPEGSKCTGPDDCTHWVTCERRQAKFYFQHFSKEQMHRFVDMMNAQSLHIGMPAHFYVLPFFCSPVKPENQDG